MYTSVFVLLFTLDDQQMCLSEFDSGVPVLLSVHRVQYIVLTYRCNLSKIKHFIWCVCISWSSKDIWYVGLFCHTYKLSALFIRTEGAVEYAKPQQCELLAAVFE